MERLLELAAHPCGYAIHRVDSHVYLGGSDAAAPNVLKAHGITRVVRLYAGPPDAQAPGVQYFVFPAQDSSDFDIRPVAVEAVQQILKARAAGEKILVHCHAGISRSATVVVLYLMIRYGVPLATALPALREIRPCVNPNPGFLACLAATDSRLARLRASRREAARTKRARARRPAALEGAPAHGDDP